LVKTVHWHNIIHNKISIWYRYHELRFFTLIYSVVASIATILFFSPLNSSVNSTTYNVYHMLHSEFWYKIWDHRYNRLSSMNISSQTLPPSAAARTTTCVQHSGTWDSRARTQIYFSTGFLPVLTICHSQHCSSNNLRP
jgi:Na+/melibiose symporter-like transporter